MYEIILVKGPKFLAATSNLRLEQNLVHLSRFMRFSQKVVGVTLMFWISLKFSESVVVIKGKFGTKFF